MQVYLDHAATTPVRAEVASEVARVHALGLGNPSSRHASGRLARRMIDDAREELAGLIGAKPGEVVFTSGGTEANDLAVHGVAARRAGAVVCSAVEHEAVLAPVDSLAGRVVPVDQAGRIDLDDLGRQLIDARSGDGVALVSVMLVNNENGVRQPLDEVAEVIDDLVPGTPLHTDAVQAAGWLDLAEAAAAADLISISGHKVGAPVGIGALVVRDGVQVEARLRGGGQERERRSGTQNVAGAVALARAVASAVDERASVVPRVAALRDRLLDGVLTGCDGIVVPTGTNPSDRASLVGGTVQFCVEGVESEALLFLLDDAGIAASAGSACAAGALEPSHVLAAMGVPEGLAKGAVRFSVGRSTTETEVDAAVDVLCTAVSTLRSARAA